MRHRTAATALVSLSVPILLLATAADAVARPMFPIPIIEAGTGPYYSVSADFNRDGRADLAIANAFSDDVSVLLGDGDGNFEPQVRFTAGDWPFWIEAGDLDGDGKLDLAVANYESGDVSVMLGRGDGSFAPQQRMGQGHRPFSLAIGDMNGDGRQDIVVSHFGLGQVFVHLGLGNGTFASPLITSLPNGVLALALGDLDDDGNRDVIVTGSFGGVVSALLGAGDGTFSQAVTSPAGVNPEFVAVGHFDGDGKQDLAVADAAVDRALILMGRGDGSFESPVFHPVGKYPLNLTVSDFNHDGALDVASLNSAFTFGGGPKVGDVSVLLGRGDGSFEPEVRVETRAKLPFAFSPADFDQDGFLDLAVASQSAPSTVIVAFGRGDGGFTVRRQIVATGAVPEGFAIGDLNEDGIPDLAVPRRDASYGFFGRVEIYLGNGDGSQTHFGGFGGLLNPGLVQIEDLDRDGHQDLFVASYGVPRSIPGDLRVFRGRGDGTFVLQQNSVLASSGQPRLADLNGDGLVDLVQVTSLLGSPTAGIVQVRAGRGDGTFGPSSNTAAGSSTAGFVIADFNADGRMDIATANLLGHYFEQDISILLGKGDLTFQPVRYFGGSGGAAFLAVGEFSGDGVPDIVAGYETLTFGNSAAGGLRLFRGDGLGGFSPEGFLAPSSRSLAVIGADFDGDGVDDVAAWVQPLQQPEADLEVFTGVGDGTFRPPVRFKWFEFPNQIAMGDLNLDGRPDLVLGGQSTVDILLNQSRPPNHPPTAVAMAVPRAECTSPDGADVLLDGSASSDPDSSPGTLDDIVAFDWFEDFGLTSQRVLGSGQVITVTLPLGAHSITLKVTDSFGASALAEAEASVIDTTPPVIIPAVSPEILWPPNHRLVGIDHTAVAVDLCGPSFALLAFVESSEPDDAPGGSDGTTTGDIVLQASEDVTLFLRAERDARGTGRVYTLTFGGLDASGNFAWVTGQVMVPHDRGGQTDPLNLSVIESAPGTVVSWRYIQDRDALRGVVFNVARGSVGNLRETASTINMGPVVCIEAASPDTNTLRDEDADLPRPGDAYFYVVEYRDAEGGLGITYGQEEAAKPRYPGSGGCH